MSSDNDRKRSPETDHLPSKKAKVLDELSTEGPLSQADVVYFKKEAIYRQMLNYKEQVLKLQGKAKRLSMESEGVKHVITVLTAWYNQILALFDNNEGTNEDVLVPFPESTDDEKLEQLRRAVSRALSSTLPLNFDATKLQQLSSIKSQNQILARENESLLVQVDQLQKEILGLINSRERNASKTLKRVDDSRKEVSEDVKVKEETPQPVPSGDQNGNSRDVGDEQWEKLNLELEQLKSCNQVLNSQLEEMTGSNKALLLKTTALESKIHNLDESDLQENVIYKKIVKNNQSLQEQISKVSKLNTVNVAKLTEFEEKHNELKSLIEADIVKENESLKQTLAKVEQDLVRVRTTRDELLGKNTLLSKQIEDQKTAAALLELNAVYSKRIDELIQSRVEVSGDAKIELLNNEIKEIESAFKQTREFAMKKMSTAIDHENQVKKLTIEKNKADQKYFASMRLKDSLSSENKVLKQQVAKSQDLVKSFTELESNYLNKIEVLTKSIVDYKIIKENSLQDNYNLQDSIKNLNVIKDSLEKDVERKEAKIVSMTTEVVELKDQLNKQSLQLDSLRKEFANAESLINKYRTNNTDSIIQEDEQQLEALRSIAKCSVCTKNWKDTAITVCGHVFCSKCTQERLAARLRRCPTCNKGFSINDLLTVHL
ncbi:uncharacterized protein LODBEIA_P57470 [Lodderomyces beijingensis]|uniref:E3 ubiquitin protein ligase n=1 Tax=Lodderomyces beijingensis TaxID=1775926 RepID=A0ABP0ZL94_9ASCO